MVNTKNNVLTEGDIHLRDKTQFELMTEYIPANTAQVNKYQITFYFFIPFSLQIRSDTYSKQQFYADQTNIIRLKTPTIALKNLSLPSSARHPLLRAQQLLREENSHEQETEAVEELKLYANMARSAIRTEAHSVWILLGRAENTQDVSQAVSDLQMLCNNIQTLRSSFFGWQKDLKPFFQEGHMEEYVRYIDEFISTLCEHYEASLLQVLEQVQERIKLDEALLQELRRVKQLLIECMAKESQHRSEYQERSPFADDPERGSEYMLYRSSVLKKFVTDVLFLSLNRTEPRKKFLSFVTPVVAGFAMLIYLYFLSFHSIHPVFDSSAFLLITAVLYVMRDRMKEKFTQVASRLSSRWFPDYQTTICTPNGDLTLGTINEWVSFPLEIPEQIQRIRQKTFRGELHQAKRNETVLCFSKQVTLFPQADQEEGRGHALVDVFRYNIHQFLIKAADPYKEQLVFNPSSQRVESIKSPKVYHVPMILQYDFVNAEGNAEVMHKCYRIILDKEGIKRIEKV